MNPGDKTREEVTHYYGDSCVPPHTSLEDERMAERFRESYGSQQNVRGSDGSPPPSKPSVPPKPGAATYRDQARSILDFHAGLENNDHGIDTPQRFLDMLSELTAHKHCNGDCIKFRTFPNDGMDEMIVVQGIPFVSVCNHHIVPFIGHAHVAYVPKDEIVGLSKFARVVDHFARALQVQERLTAQVADYLEERLSPRGVGIVLQAEHLCMTIRGVQKPGALTTTASMKGVFSDHERTAKAEFMRYLNGGH